jgi:hypothetical protein
MSTAQWPLNFYIQILRIFKSANKNWAQFWKISQISQSVIYKFYCTNSLKKKISESFDTNLERQKFAAFEGRLI